MKADRVFKIVIYTLAIILFICIIVFGLKLKEKANKYKQKINENTSSFYSQN